MGTRRLLAFDLAVEEKGEEKPETCSYFIQRAESGIKRQEQQGLACIPLKQKKAHSATVYPWVSKLNGLCLTESTLI